MEIDPPFQETYKTLFMDVYLKEKDQQHKLIDVVEECELPLFDINRLTLGHIERDKCMEEMAEAASKLGFFQAMNHGVPQEILDSLKFEQMKVFHEPFNKKADEIFLNISANGYRLGNPIATCLSQLSWSEAFHISQTDVSRMEGHKKLRYPPCPIPSDVYGMMPHTDSCFLTILYQDQIGGLQFMKDGGWLSVRPKLDALTISTGDLFQAFSSDVYRSIEHKVVAPQEVERFSAAYFFCLSYDAVKESCIKPARYRKFSFGEFRQQVQKIVQATGDKVGLSRFLL